MLLNEAIRLGAMLSPQSRSGTMVEGEGRCALGAAADALGLPGEHDAIQGRLVVPYVALIKAFPILEQVIPGTGTMVMDTIWIFNDRDGMSREQIALWVEGIESTLDPVHEDVQVQEGGG